jgi:hypothetical protein
MPLTSAQNATLKAFILADPTLSAQPNNSDGNDFIRIALNVIASPDFWVWRTFVSQQEIVSATTQDGTVWNWTTYIGRSQGERDGWREMFADTGGINPSLTNVRQGLADIFSGAGGAAQRTHLLTVGRRKATIVEKLFATGTGSTASPAIMVIEGGLTINDIDVARNS